MLCEVFLAMEEKEMLHPFTQPTRLYRHARVVSILVKHISTEGLSCLYSLKNAYRPS